MRKILSIVAALCISGGCIVVPAFAKAQPDLKKIMGDKTATVTGTFEYIEYNDDVTSVLTLKSKKVKVSTQDRKIKQALNNKQLLINLLKDPPTVCTEGLNNIDFVMFGETDKFDIDVKVNAAGGLDATKIRSLTFHCDVSKNTFESGVEGPGHEKASNYHGTVQNLNRTAGTFELAVTDPPYLVKVKKSVTVWLQNSPDAVYFVPKGKWANVQDGDNAYVFGIFNTATNSIKGTQIRIVKPLPW